MYNRTTFSGGLVRKGDLQKSKNDNSFLSLVVAKSYQQKQTDGTYKEVHKDFVNCIAFGRLAENIARAELPIGTRVIVTGQLDGREVSSYTNKDGQTVPATTEEYVKLDNLAPDLSIMNVLLKVEKVPKDGTTSSTNSTNMNTFTSTSTSNSNVTNEADNLFGQTSSTDTTSNQDAEDDPFADLFN